MSNSRKKIDSSESSTSKRVIKHHKSLFFSATATATARIDFIRDSSDKRVKIQSGRGPAPLYPAFFHYQDTKKKVVIKKFKTSSSIYPELFITPKVQHPNILRASLLVKDDCRYLMMPHFGIGTLRDFQHVLIKEEHTNIRNYILQQMLDALIYLAENNIQHQDLHPGNILIDQNMNIKIIDFGQADHIDFTQPIFGQYIYGDTDELSTTKTDSYTFCTTLLDQWSISLTQDKFLAEACKLLKSACDLSTLKGLHEQLQSLTRLARREIELFCEKTNIKTKIQHARL